MKTLAPELQTLLNQLSEQQKFNIALQKLNAAHQATILKMSEQMAQLQQRIDKLLQLLYGVKSEKRKNPGKHPQQMLQQNHPKTKKKAKPNQPMDDERCPLIYHACELNMMCQKRNNNAIAVLKRCSAWVK